jgi:hypothetical protein
MSMYSYYMFMYLHHASWHSSATLTEVFPCFFLSCKTWGCILFVHVVFCLVCIVVYCLVYIVIVVLCVLLLCCCTMGVLLLSYVYLLYYVHIAVVTLDAGLLARSQYSEGPATGHLDTGFSWFPCVYKRMLRWFPRFQVAATCFSCSPPDLNVNLFVISFIYLYTCKITTTTGWQPNCS